MLSTVTLDQFMQTFNTTALSNIRQYFAGFAAALKGRSQSLNDSLDRMAPFAGNLAGIMQTLDAETPQLQQVFASTGVVMQALGDRAGALQAAIKEGNALFSVTALRDRDISALMQSLAPFLRQVQATSQTITATSADFDRAMIDMLPVGGALAPALGRIRADLPALRQLFRDLPSTMTAGQRGFPAISKILRALPSGFGPLYPALRQFVPLMQLFANYALTGFVHPLASAAAAENGTLVGPNGKIISRPTATLYTSNETLAGWVKRLPTHRSNDYPKPDAFDAIAQQGFLESFDCRDVNNPDYSPPQAVGGTGVPPCLTQGPWWYGGKRAYYPRLEQASP